MPYGFNDDKSKFDLDDLIGSVATIETSPATTNHAKGEYIVYDSQLYEVTAAIASGEALVVGTNISATTTGTELSALKNGLTNLDKFIRTGTNIVKPTFSMSRNRWQCMIVLGNVNGAGNIASVVFIGSAGSTPNITKIDGNTEALTASVSGNNITFFVTGKENNTWDYITVIGIFG